MVITIGAPNIVRKGEAHGISLGWLAEVLLLRRQP